jgi:ribonuclease BN (tRNA processing enzyme)
MSAEFTVTFWGVRGSHPVPGKNTLRFGGNTTCLGVTIGKLNIVIDAGTGIIEAGKKIAADYFKETKKGTRGTLRTTLFFTHLHHDHTQGLPFFTPLFLGQSFIHFFGPKNFGEELEVVLERSITPPNFPINFHQASSEKRIQTIYENHVILLDTDEQVPVLKNRFMDSVEMKKSSVLVRVLNDYSHPANGVFIYRIEHGNRSVVFATDVEGYMFGDARLAQFAKGADLLVHDAQYSVEQYTALPVPKQGFGHSIPEMAIEVAKLAGVKTLALTHHDPASDDELLKKHEERYKKQFPKLFYAREGLTFTLE